jgi:hypothetical protein
MIVTGYLAKPGQAPGVTAGGGAVQYCTGGTNTGGTNTVLVVLMTQIGWCWFRADILVVGAMKAHCDTAAEPPGARAVEMLRTALAISRRQRHPSASAGMRRLHGGHPGGAPPAEGIRPVGCARPGSLPPPPPAERLMWLAPPPLLRLAGAFSSRERPASAGGVVVLDRPSVKCPDRH